MYAHQWCNLLSSDLGISESHRNVPQSLCGMVGFHRRNYHLCLSANISPSDYRCRVNWRQNFHSPYIRLINHHTMFRSMSYILLHLLWSHKTLRSRTYVSLHTLLLDACKIRNVSDADLVPLLLGKQVFLQLLNSIVRHLVKNLHYIFKVQYILIQSISYRIPLGRRKACSN